MKHFTKGSKNTETMNSPGSWPGPEAGFSYAEIIAALAIMLILGGIVGSNGAALVRRARIGAARSQIAIYLAALDAYRIDCGDVPTEEQGLSALWEKPHLHPVPANWRGPYIGSPPPNDPWGVPYSYRTANVYGLPYTICSMGADRREGGYGENDDVCSWD
jgi:general secretion pathway protein G